SESVLFIGRLLWNLSLVFAKRIWQPGSNDFHLPYYRYRRFNVCFFIRKNKLSLFTNRTPFRMEPRPYRGLFKWTAGDPALYPDECSRAPGHFIHTNFFVPGTDLT